MDFVKQTLETLAHTQRFNHWMYEQVAPYCGQLNLEIGSGLGNLSQHFIQAQIPLVLSDVDAQCCRHLQTHFPQHTVLELDAQCPQALHPYPQWQGRFDSVFALNVFEHLADDKQALQNCTALLKDRGFLIILVPSYPSLYNAWDKDLGHHRRYTAAKLRTLVQSEAQLHIEREYAFNAAAIPGWWWFGKVLQRPQLPQGPLAWYDRLVPLWRVLDHSLAQRIGISRILIARKQTLPSD